MRKTKKILLAELLAVSILAAGSKMPIMAESTDLGLEYDQVTGGTEHPSTDENQGQPVLDQTAPVVMGVEDGQSYDVDEITFTVFDEFLDLVTLNREPVHTTGKNAEITVKYRSGSSNVYKIEAWDKAGNHTVCTFILKGDSQSLDQQGYKVSGTKGNHDWYTSPVIVTATNGNKICSMSYGIFKNEIRFTESGSAEFYLFNTQTAKVSKVSLGELKIDTCAPVIQGVEDEKWYRDTVVSVEVSDDNLDSVTVNGIEQEIVGNRITLDFERSLETTTYTIIARELSGRETICTFTLEAIETLTRGKSYDLESGIAYYLGDGEWSLIDDTVTYYGNMIFYVDHDGIYEFRE